MNEDPKKRNQADPVLTQGFKMQLKSRDKHGNVTEIIEVDELGNEKIIFQK